MNTTVNQAVSKDEIGLFASVLGEDSSPMARAASASFFRRYFSNDFMIEDESIFEVIIQGLLKLLEQPATHSSLIQGRLDSAWAITNIVCQSSHLCHLVVRNGGIGLLSETAAVQPHGSELKMQCYWALGNVAADCQECKIACRETNILMQLANSLNNDEFFQLFHLKNVVWCTLNIVRGGIAEAVPLDAIGMILTFCEKIIRLHRSSKKMSNYVKDCIWIVASLADDMDRGLHIDIICGMPRMLEDLMDILLNGNSLLHHACLRVFGNIATGNNEQTEIVTRIPNFYEVLVKFLRVGQYLAHEAAWLASNVAAGTAEHLSILLTDDRLYEQVLEGVNCDELKLKKECAWIVTNMLSGADEEHHRWLVGTGIIDVYGAILELEDSRVVTRALMTLERLLRDYPNFCNLIHEEQILKKIKPALLNLVDVAPRIAEIKRQIANYVEDCEETEVTVFFL